MKKSDPPTRIARSPVETARIGEEETEEVTRALDRSPLIEHDVHPADADGPTRMVAEGENLALAGESPADGDGPTVSLSAEAHPLLNRPQDASPADGERPTVTMTSPLTSVHPPAIQSEPPPVDVTRALPRSALIGEDDVPVTEGTALLPRNFLLGSVAGADADLEKILGAPPRSTPRSSEETVVGERPKLQSVVIDIDDDELSAPPQKGGWGRAVVIFLVAFLLTGGALLYAWHTYVR